MNRFFRVLAIGLIASAAACAVEGEDVDENVDTSEDAATVAEAKTPFIRGDANGDGEVDISDVSVVWAFAYSGGEVACEDAADINDDGRVDYMDGIGLQNFLFNGGAAPAAPFPDAGLEPRFPSNDSWHCGDGSLLCDDSNDCSSDHYCASAGPGFGSLTLCQPDTFIRGDANDDGEVDISDVQLIWDVAYSGGESPCMDAADVNDDGWIDYRDGWALQSYLFNGGSPPAAPHDEAGFDETDDDQYGCRR